MSFLGCAVALCLFVLSTKHLMVVYMYLMSVGVVFVSYWSNFGMVKAVIAAVEAGATPQTSILDDLLYLNFTKLMEPGGCGAVVVQNYLVQCALAFIFLNIHLGPR